MRMTSERFVVGAVLAMSLVTLVLQAVVLRPHLWPAGAGLALTGDTVMGTLAAPRPVAVIRPPDVSRIEGADVTVARVWPGGRAERAGLQAGMRVGAIVNSSGETLSLADGLPADSAGVLRVWREMHRLRPGSAITIEVTGGDKPAGGDKPLGLSETRTIILEQPAIWSTGGNTLGPWLRLHLGPLSQVTAFLAGAATLLFLGASGTTAALMTLALIFTAVANGGPLLGAEMTIPVLGPLLLFFNWIVTPLSFPIIGLAVLYFPHQAEILDRHRWIVPAMALTALPMLVIGLSSAAFLLGSDSVLPALTWLAERPWTFDASFALALAANVLIVIEGIGRYRTNLDADERRRIQIVVYTGVPAVFAYALKTGIPLLGGLAGRPIELPWMIEALLQAIVLLPAFGLPYAVAVRHVFSPRTVLRRSLQYAFAKRTLTVLVALPVIALVASLVQQRDQSLSAIIGGRPLFYLICLVMLALAVRYRDTAQRWLDQRFFRAEYDAREILVSLAGRVPYEADPRDLVARVVTQIDSALHPESIAVLAGEVVSSQTPGGGSVMLGSFEPVSALRAEAAPLRADSALVTLLRWSDKPLEVFLDDEQSPVSRVPPADRMWLASLEAALLVPIFAGGSDPRPLVGVIALGHKQSEEPYTPEDRELLRGIAVQMGVALDLSRLRKQIGATFAPGMTGGMEGSTPTMVVGGTGTPAVMGVGVVVDGKYRVDAIIGQGGMGAVFRAWDLRLERAVAIKVVRAELLSDPDSRARFKRESQIVAKLQHPAIVTVFDYGTLADGAAFLVMEFVPGEDLRSLLKRERKLGEQRMVALMSGISAGVDSAHKSGIFHRDLKPENILLPESGTGPKVVDFGVAKLTTAPGAEGSHMTSTGTIVGTPAYMAPEQLRGDAVDGRADVFSLGVMAYEMLTGKLPYGGGSFFDIGMKQAAGEIKVDTGDIPPELAAIIRRSIAYERDGRPASPGDFAEELRGITKNK
ncbi:MAG: protein kinase [Acidobacteriota bacterium]|nr:protein kinase [Acidobacteriota bacterium]